MRVGQHQYLQMDYELRGAKQFVWSLARKVGKGQVDVADIKLEKLKFQQQAASQ